MTPLLIPSLMVFIFGSCIGSFLNVCIYRVPLKKSVVTPGSFCPGCKKPIPFYCNIPILSYALLGGKCKSCRTPIPFRYPFVEFITASLAVCTAVKFGLTGQALVWFAFICILIVITFIDIDHQIIPDVLSIPGTVCFAVLAFFVLGIKPAAILAGILLGGGFLYAVALGYYLIRKEQGMGGGDIKLMAMVGSVLGVKGVLFTIFAGSLIGSISGVLIILCSKVMNIRQKIPFGPYLSGGALLYIFYGEELIRWYIQIVTK